MHTEHNMKLLYAALLLLLPFTAHSAGVIVAINGTNTLVDNEENLVLQWKVPNEHNNINLKTWELVRGEKTLANGFGDVATISKAANDEYQTRLEVTKSGEIVTVTIHYVSGEDADTYTLFGSYDRNAGQESASTTFKVKGYTPPASDESGSLSLTAIIGIVIGSILFLAIVIVLCMYYVRNKRRDRTDEESSHPMRYRKNDDKEYQIPSEPGEPLVSTKPPSTPERPPNKPPHKPSNKPPSAPTKPSAAPRKPPVAKKPPIAKKPVYSEHGPRGGRADVN